ncbi:MAG: hypothetical protein ACP5QA_04445 [Phycisphaerae bacterium]
MPTRRGSRFFITSLAAAFDLLVRNADDFTKIDHLNRFTAGRHINNGL